MGKRGGPLKSTVVTIMVSDIDKSLAKVEKLGGKTVQKKQPVGDMGFTAYFKDSEGNVVGLFQGPASK
jgi:predicted enzyme related to lactoylglutathione lyase